MDFLIYFSIFLFVLSISGIFILGKNLINILISLELILLSLNLLFGTFSLYLDDIVGQVFNLIIVTIAAAESGIGLALVLLYYFNARTISPFSASRLKG
jgi:NADH-quinone oxidoreductase subunit K